MPMPDTYLCSHSFNTSDLTPFSAGPPNSWTNSLPLGEHDEDQGEREPTHDEDPNPTHDLNTHHT